MRSGRGVFVGNVFQGLQGDTEGYSSSRDAKKASSEEKKAPSWAAIASSASRSFACHSGVQNQACSGSSCSCATCRRTASTHEPKNSSGGWPRSRAASSIALYCSSETVKTWLIIRLLVIHPAAITIYTIVQAAEAAAKGDRRVAAKAACAASRKPEALRKYLAACRGRLRGCARATLRRGFSRQPSMRQRTTVLQSKDAADERRPMMMAARAPLQR